MLLVKSIDMDRSLVMDLDAEDGEFDPMVRIEERDWGLIDTAVLVKAFRRLTELEELSITGWTRLILLVLSSSVAACSLPSLKSLKLESTFDDIDDPFHPAHYANLQCYPQLNRLEVSIVRDSDSIESFQTSIVSPYFSLVSLRSLHVHGPITSSNHRSSLLRCFPRLEELDLDDETGSASLLRLVTSLPDPSRLETLSIKFCKYAPGRMPPASPIAFNLFPSLRNLTIIGLVNLESPSFCEDLRMLPLQRIDLGYGTGLSALGLRELLNEQAQQRCLETLVLDNILASVGYDADPLEFLFYTHGFEDEETAHLNLRLFGPRWTDRFSKEGLVKLVRVAEQKGISVRGTAMDALRLEERFESGEVERERVIAREKRAKEKARRESVDGNA